MTELTTQALARWNMQDATCTFVAGRENQVFKVTGGNDAFAMRIRRPGLRSVDEVRSELDWLDAMDHAGLSVPRPQRSANGRLFETVAQHHVDMVGWLDGTPLGNSTEPLELGNPTAVFRALGQLMARLHMASDAFEQPSGFTRIHWDISGLLGENPVWGRYWDNPDLDEATRRLLTEFRQEAHQTLSHLARDLDYGLIHADLVRENVLVDGTDLRLIDFDDGGFGFRLFDVATALFKNRKEPNYSDLRASLVGGYQSLRKLDMRHLDLFMALRAVTYVGWIIPRMTEDGSAIRNRRFIADARDLCGAYLGQTAKM